MSKLTKNIRLDIPIKIDFDLPGAIKPISQIWFQELFWLLEIFKYL